MNRARWRGWLIAVLIFGFGFAAGGAVIAGIGIRMFRQSLQNPMTARGPLDRAAERIADNLEDELKLTPEESVRVRSHLAQSVTTLKTIRQQSTGEMRAELRASFRRIAAELPLEKSRELQRLIFKRFSRLGLAPSVDEENP